MVRQDADIAPVHQLRACLNLFRIGSFLCHARKRTLRAAQLENDLREGDAGGGVPAAAGAPSGGVLLYSPT